MKNKRNRIDSQDVTKAFVIVASDFISMSDDIEKARSLAYVAVIAWNISLYPQDQIPAQIRLVAQEYEKSNPGLIQADLMSQDLQRLVDKKLKEFPYIKRTITKIGVEEKGEEYAITTVSIPFVLQ